MPKKKKTLLKHSGDEELDLIENSDTQTKVPEKKKTLLKHSGDEELDLIENSDTQTKMPEKKEKTLSVRKPKNHKGDDGVKGRYSTRSTSRSLSW